jgi:MFS family permease
MIPKHHLTGIKGFYAILAGQLVSTIGSGMTRFGLGVWVLAETGDATAYTTMLFFAVFPIGLGSLFAGPLIDRWNRRRIMIIGNIVASLSTLIIAILFFLDDLALWQLYAVLFVNGIANAFILPTLQSSTPLLVPKDQLNRASGLNQLIRALEAILAPGLAGFIVASLGLGAVFIIDFVTFSISILALMMTKIPQPKRVAEHTTKISYWKDFASGFRYIRQRPAFMYLLGLFTITMFLLPGLGYSLAAPLVLSFETEKVLGMIMAAYGVGSLVGGLLMAAWRGKSRRMHGILAGMTTAGVATTLIGLNENAWLIGVSFFMTGIGFVFIVGLNRVIWQIKAAPDMQGRIFSLQAAIGVGAQSLGILLSGVLATHLFEPLMSADGVLASSVGMVIGTGTGRGIALMFTLFGLTQLLIVLVSSLIPKVRLLEDELPDAALAEAQPLAAST